ncbi:MAG: allophanate hydrolase, partial [Ferrovibrio sp.]
AELEAEPIQFNSNLGYYTNFVNYFDLAALAVPNGFQPDGLPAGITLIGPRFSEPLLAGIGEAWQRDTGLSLGATRHAHPETAPATGIANYPSVTVAVFGAHMSGLPLNYQLRELGARLLSDCSTAPDYRLYVIAGALPRPGLVRTMQGGKSILGELWQIPTAGFGAFVAAIPAPLGIGDVRLDDGRVVKGFLCEAVAAADAPDITSLGGWRAWLETSRREPALAAPR